MAFDFENLALSNAIEASSFEIGFRFNETSAKFKMSSLFSINIILLSSSTFLLYPITWWAALSVSFVVYSISQTTPSTFFLSNNNADLFIFPNLDSANIGYKIMERLSNDVVAIGPVVYKLII